MADFDANTILRANDAYDWHHAQGWITAAMVQLSQGLTEEARMTLACLSSQIVDLMTLRGLQAIQGELLPAPDPNLIKINPPPAVNNEGGNKLTLGGS